MARKLTEEEHALMELVRDGISPVIPSEQRSAASGIASSLVRFGHGNISASDLEDLFGKYGLEDAETIEAIAKAVLEQQGEDSYTINAWLCDEAARRGREAEAAEADEAEAEKPEAADAEEQADIQPAPVVAEEDASPSDAPAEGEPAEEAKPKRRRRRSRKDAGANEPAPEEPAAAEAETPAEANEPEAGVEAKPKRRRRSRKDASVSETAPEETPAAEAETPAEDSEAEASDAEAKPKRRRRHRVRKAKEEQQEEAPAEETSESTDETEAAAPAADDFAEKEPEEAAAEAEDAQAEEAEEDEALGIVGGDEEAEAPQGPARKIVPPHPAHSRDLRKIPYVRRGGENDAEIRQKIVQLDERFWMNGWLLSHPKAYVLFEHEIETMNDILQDGMLPGDITRRQLAYQMGGDEKFFEYGSDGFRLLRALGMEDIIRHRPLPKSDLVYHAPRRRKHMRVLVTENLDPYLDVHDLMYEDGRTTILGERIHAVVLGGGTPIIEHNRLSLLLDTLGADSIEVLYWGDIDRAGISIMNKLERELNGRYGFAPFAPAYELMVKKASERFPDAQDNESTKQVNIEDYDVTPLLNVLSDEAAAYAKTVVDSCELIPQEILVKQDL
ncbi:MAG: Wadjet anti-phage system protein JetD domain-containing protein [Atopobiaceae bacterium]